MSVILRLQTREIANVFRATFISSRTVRQTRGMYCTAKYKGPSIKDVHKEGGGGIAKVDKMWTWGRVI